MLAEQRRELILHVIRNGPGAEVVELARRFDVSEMTVLAHAGRLTRVHGGAVTGPEPPFAQIAVERLVGKRPSARAGSAKISR